MVLCKSVIHSFGLFYPLISAISFNATTNVMERLMKASLMLCIGVAPWWDIWTQSPWSQQWQQSRSQYLLVLPEAQATLVSYLSYIQEYTKCNANNCSTFSPCADLVFARPYNTWKNSLECGNQLLEHRCTSYGTRKSQAFGGTLSCRSRVNVRYPD